MTSEMLEKACISHFGGKTGKKLYRAMEKIRRKDFCVAIAWRLDQVSISRSCSIRGKIFLFSSDYDALILPNGEIKDFESLSYHDIAQYLPFSSSYGHVRHCQFDYGKRIMKL